MMLWDLAGNEEFDHVRASYLRGVAGAVLVCDLTRAETLMRLERYVEDLFAISSQTRLAIAANKADLTDQYAISEAQIAEMAKSLDAAYYLTSAKRGDEVDTLFRHLGKLLVV
jgi:signal recognition particle receptor subunit beta